MEMLCPDCMGPLVSRDGQSAKCSLHGGEYRILFMRGQTEALPTNAAPNFSAAVPAIILQPASELADSPYRSPSHVVQTCARHPQVRTDMNCARCAAAICGTCGFPQGDGTQVCPDCVTQFTTRPVTARTVPDGVMCSRHPQVQAERYCQSCRIPMCGTCDFALPGEVHVCPECVSKPQGGLSSGRRTMLVWSYLMAIWCTLGLAVLLVGALNIGGPAEEVLGAVIFVFVFTPSIIGTALSVGALDRRLSNPLRIWVSILWNGLVLALLLFLSVLGLFVA